MGNLVGADSGIGCLESKYHYAYWRPITAIRNATSTATRGPSLPLAARWAPGPQLDLEIGDAAVAGGQLALPAQIPCDAEQPQA